MGATLGRLVDDYKGLIETLRERADELGISRLEIDRIGGLASGYAGKVLGEAGGRPKRLWPIGLEALLGTLGLRVLLIEDHAATARTLKLRKPVDSSNQRFGNKCNSKPALCIESTEPIKIAAPKNGPPKSRAHLRVVQPKRKGAYGIRNYG
jgi:hypothetical protein